MNDLNASIPAKFCLCKKVPQSILCLIEHKAMQINAVLNGELTPMEFFDKFTVIFRVNPFNKFLGIRESHRQLSTDDPFKLSQPLISQSPAFSWG